MPHLVVPLQEIKPGEVEALQGYLAHKKRF